MKKSCKRKVAGTCWMGRLKERGGIHCLLTSLKGSCYGMRGMEDGGIPSKEKVSQNSDLHQTGRATGSGGECVGGGRGRGCWDRWRFKSLDGCGSSRGQS